MSYQPPVTPPGVPEVTVDDLVAAQAQGAVVVDVREPDEYEAGHVAGAVPIPLGEVMARVGEVTRDEPVYVICAVGARSGKAAQFYRSQGIDARNVAGGTKAWIQQGNPVIRGPERGN